MVLLALYAVIIYCYVVTAANVVVLSDRNFTEKISGYSAALVKFYVPWCGHCKNLAPEFVKAARELQRMDPPITLIEVDCSEGGKEVCSIAKVKGYPTLKIYKFGELAFEYAGPKHAEGIVQYMKSTVSPGSVELKTMAELDELLAKDINFIFGFFEPTNSKAEKEFHGAANSLKDRYQFVHTYSNRIMSRFGYRNEVVLFRASRLQSKLEQPQLKYEGEVTVYKLRSWITDHYHGYVGIRTTINMDDFRRPLIVVYFKVDLTGKHSKETSYWRNRAMMVAKKFYTPGKRKVNFAMSDSTEFSREMQDLGLGKVEETPLVAARDSQEQRYVMRAPFSTENLEQFAEDLLAGNMRVYVKSEPVPESNDGPVKVLVASNYHDVVDSINKSVFIHFHAPWCGECPELEKTFAKLSKKLNRDEILLASMDATKNDVPKHFVVKRFPAVFLVGKEDKASPKLYEGKYELNDLLQYLTDAVPNVIKPKQQQQQQQQQQKQQQQQQEQPVESETPPSPPPPAAAAAEKHGVKTEL